MQFKQGLTARTVRAPRGKAALASLFGGLLLTAMTPAMSDGLGQNNNPHLPPLINRVPDANLANGINEGPIEKQNFDAANAERKRQISAESVKLLKLATELQAEVDKADKDVLSLGVIHKAGEIEKLAHSVKEKMQLTVGAS